MPSYRLNTLTSAPVGGSSAVSLLGESDAFKELMFRVGEVAPTDATVLLLGETGTGKSLIAQAIHERSAQRSGQFVTVNCAALPAPLLESELSGAQGAPADARSSQIGRVEPARDGTVFLDEVAELPLAAQATLLRFLQEGESGRLASAPTRRVRTRVVAGTSRDIREEVQAGRFRRDLYFRINVFPVAVPPLRARQGDIPLLVHRLVARYAQRIGRRIDRVPRELIEQLQQRNWPGNVRELENVIERAVIVSHDGALRLDATEDAAIDTPASDTLAEVERSHIRRVLAATAWQIEGHQGAARTLGLKPSTLRSRMQKLGIQRARMELADVLRHRARPS